MTNISSIHIQPASINEFFHNSREKDTKNSIGDKSQNYCNRKAIEAIEMYRKDLEEKSNLYFQKQKRKLPKNTKTLFSAIINLKKDSTIEDVENVAKYLEEKLKVKIYQIAIHEDEGHFDENNKFIKNRHAHIMFGGLDENAKSIKRNKLNIHFLRQLQTDVANILKMQRGQKRAVGERKRLDTYEYKKAQKIFEPIIKEKEQKINELKLTKKQLEQEIKELREKMKNFNSNLEEKEFTQEDYKTLSQIKKMLKAKNLEEVKQKLENFESEIKERIKKRSLHLIDKYSKETGILNKENIIETNIAKKIINTTCRTENLNLPNIIKEHKTLTRENASLNEENSLLKEENKQLRKEVAKLAKENEKLKNENSLLKQKVEKLLNTINKLINELSETKARLSKNFSKAKEIIKEQTLKKLDIDF